MGFDFSKIDVSDIVAILTFLSIVIGGIFAYKKWSTGLKLKRAEYINTLIEKIRLDQRLSDFIYMIDYSKIWYTKEFHDSGELEAKVDYSLSYFSYICYLKSQKIIKEKEFQFLKYDVDRILMNTQVIDYFYNLYHFSSKFNTPLAFNYLFQYAKMNGFLEPDFYDNKAWILPDARYHHFLLF